MNNCILLSLTKPRSIQPHAMHVRGAQRNRTYGRGRGRGWAGARADSGSSFSASRREEQPLGHVGQELEERAGEVARRSVEGE